MAKLELSTDDIDQHLIAFVDSFVIGARKDRWKNILTRRIDAHRDSSKLHDYLDKRFCKNAKTIIGDVTAIVGVFYDFFEEPREVTAQEALQLGTGRDAIFSITPGQLAYYFFHEDELWQCAR